MNSTPTGKLGNSSSSSASCWDDIGVDEVIALEEQRLTGSFCERVSEAVAEIQFGGMSAAFTEITIGLARNSRLSFGDGFNNDACFFDKIIEASAGNRIAASVDHQRGFNEVGGGHATYRVSLDRERAISRFGFVAKDCDKRRRVDDRGKPRSSYSSSS
jgi:hypothetical protein